MTFLLSSLSALSVRLPSDLTMRDYPADLPPSFDHVSVLGTVQPQPHSQGRTDPPNMRGHLPYRRIGLPARLHDLVQRLLVQLGRIQLVDDDQRHERRGRTGSGGQGSRHGRLGSRCWTCNPGLKGIHQPLLSCIASLSFFPQQTSLLPNRHIPLLLVQTRSQSVEHGLACSQQNLLHIFLRLDSPPLQPTLASPILVSIGTLCNCPIVYSLIASALRSTNLFKRHSSRNFLLMQARDDCHSR